MAINVGSNFLFKGEEFLDKRQNLVNSLDDLKNWDISVPNGWEVYFEGTWYTYRPDLPKNDITGFFIKRIKEIDETISSQIEEVNEKIDGFSDTVNEVKIKQNILVADTFEDLQKDENWIIDGKNWCYPGIIVSVIKDTDPEENGMWMLTNSDYKNPLNWIKVGEETIFISDTEPLRKELIWVDTTNSFTPTTVNEDVASMIKTLQELQNKVNNIEYAFTHEISFGDFTNNLKTEISKQPTLEPNTEETVKTDKITMPDGTITTITTTVSVNTINDDGVITTTTTTTVDATNSSGNSVTQITKVVAITTEDDSETVLSQTSEKITTTIKIETDGSKTTKIVAEKTNEEGETEVSSTLTNYFQTIIGDEKTEKTITTIVTTLDPESSFEDPIIIDRVETVEKISVTTNEDTTIENKNIVEKKYDGSRIETDLIITKVKSIEDSTITTTTKSTVREYDTEGGLISEIEDEKTETEVSEDFVTYTPNAKHLRIKMGTYKELLAAQNSENGSPFLSGELLYCYDKNYLYIISPKDNSLILVNGGGNGGSSGTVEVDLTNVDEINFNTTLASNPKNPTKYTVRVDRKGDLICYPTSVDTSETPPSSSDIVTGIPSLNVASKALYLAKFYINSLFCGGITSDKYSYKKCDYNFVELSNLTKKDINLKGLSLQYASSGTDWKVLPLEGTIKAGSTFLIRGAQCSISDINTTIINVPEPDMEWYDNGSLIKFSDVTAKFLLIYGTEPCKVVNPYYTDNVSGSTYCEWGYIDSVGLNIPKSTSSTTTIDGFEKAQFAQLTSDRIFTKYYTMDPVKQATKAIGSRSNANDWYYIDLTTANEDTGLNSVGVNVKDYIPKPSKDNKDIFYNKTHIDPEIPEMVTVTFGIEATDNGKGATRCFNWISKGYYDEYLWYRVVKVGTQEQPNNNWTKVESFKEETFTSRPVQDQYEIYNRQRVYSTSGEAFTSHKYILRGLTAGIGKPVEYEYKVGRENHQSPTYKFTVRNKTDCTEFSFIQTSDQQGFNKDEYIVWQKTAEKIRQWELEGNLGEDDEKYNDNGKPEVKGFHFIMNTGDMTQNGNRLNEWLDYYNAGNESLFSEFEQMYIIGNNDLCPELYQGPEALGDGEDASKINGINFQFFYTYEIDPNNPPFVEDTAGKSYYIHSLYSFNYGNTHFLAVNSEITGSASGTIGKLYNNADVYGYMKQWCEKDLNSIDRDDTPWIIAYCHEMPFTIITDSLITNWKGDPSKYTRGGSHLNTVGNNQYWFSQLLENYGVQLCLGGHKHTYSCSRHIRENYKWNWTGEVVKNNLGQIILQQGVDYSTENVYPWKYVKEGYITSEEITKYVVPTEFKTMTPIVQILSTESSSFVDQNNSDMCHLEKLQQGQYYDSPLYVMCQATGYKQTSNKELPAGNVIIPWLENYFPAVGGAAAAGQKYPFYIKWNITPDYIRGDVFKLENIMTSGKFSINNPNPNKIIRIKGNGSSTNSIIIEKS